MVSFSNVSVCVTVCVCVCVHTRARARALGCVMCPDLHFEKFHLFCHMEKIKRRGKVGAGRPVKRYFNK